MDATRPNPTDLVEYHEAFSSLRAAKNWFWWLLFVAMVVDVAAFAAVRFWPVMGESASFQQRKAMILQDSSVETVVVEVAAIIVPEAAVPAVVDETVQPVAAEPVATQPAASQPARAIATVDSPGDRARYGELLYQNLRWILPAARMMGMISAALLVVVLASSLHVTLSGRMGGAGYLASSFVWSIVLAALFVPWSMAFPADLGSGVAGARQVLPGVLFGLDDVVDWTIEIVGGKVTWEDWVLYYARFIGYPVLALLIWLTVQVKFARGYHQVAVDVPVK
jgi:hypothetical protein